MFRLSRLVWRDAASRYWAGLAVACIPGVYLWREWPPWVVRDALWRLDGAPLLWTVAVLSTAYGLLSLGVSRQLVASERLAYWRQHPISPAAWRVFHGVHLLLLHSPALGTLSYLLAPGGALLCVSTPASVALVTVGPVAWQLGHPKPERRQWSVPVPAAARPAVLLARLLGLACIRRRPAAAVSLVIGSVALAALGRVAVSHVVSAGEPVHATAWGFTAAATSIGAVAVWTAWPLVRHDHWWLDSMGVGPATQRAGSVLLVVVASLPALAVLLSTLSLLSVAGVVGVVGTAAGTLVWAGTVALWIDAGAVARRMPERRHGGRFALALLLPIPLTLLHPVMLVFPVVIAWRWSARAAQRAATVRRRFEIDDVGDDHD